MTTATPTGILTEPQFLAREQTHAELCSMFSADELAGVARCAERLHALLPHQDVLERNTVLVAYGGGKDSSYMLAFVRAVQLHLFAVHGATFSLRCVTNRHAGMPEAVMGNMDRVYRALRLPVDPQCELLLVDGHEVRPFRVDEPHAAHVVARNRLDILMTGHRTAGDGRPTFCNACNLSMANAFGVGAAYGDGADVIVTGDSRREQRAYAVWIHRLERKVRGRAVPEQRNGFGGVLQALDTIAGSYFGDLYGPDEPELVEQRRIATSVDERLQFFSIYDDTHYDAGSHWAMLTGYLGFEFDTLAFSFTESDCGNPALMAHLRGLKCERVFGRGYAEGIAEYVDFATRLMRTKEFPERLVETMRERYAGAAGVERMRAMMDAYALEAYGFTEEQLVCLVHAPFAGKGEHLERYLATERPDLADRVDDVHALLVAADEPMAGSAERALCDVLESVSGLSLRQLRTLYLSPPSAAAGGSPGDLIGAILDNDPHKDVIATRHSSQGPEVLEQISGR